MRKYITAIVIVTLTMALCVACQNNTTRKAQDTSSGSLSERNVDSLVSSEISSGGETISNEGSVSTYNAKGSGAATTITETESSSNSFSKKNSSLTKYSINITKDMLVGDNINFQVGINKNIHSSDGQPFDILIAKSLSELNELYQNDVNPNQDNYIEKYNSTFFNENAVIIMFITENSGSISNRIDSLVKKDGELCIGMTIMHPEVGTCDMAYWRIALEVKKSDISDINRISYFISNVNIQ